MTLIGFDGYQILLKIPAWEYKRLVIALANMDDNNTDRE